MDSQCYTNSIGRLVIIDKVLAKQDVTIDSSLTAYGSDGSVIGKSSDTITLTEGQYNYFCYTFEKDVRNDELQYQARAQRDNIMAGARNAVEMVQYNRSGDDLYITFRQVKDDLGAFAGFKLLYYRGDKIVGAENGYFSIYATNLTGRIPRMWLRYGCTARILTGLSVCLNHNK